MRLLVLRSNCNMNGNNISKGNVIHDFFIQVRLRFIYNKCSYYGRKSVTLC